MDVDGAVERMRGPLVALRDKVAAARDIAQTQLDALQEGLAARAALAQQRATLQLCVDAQHAAAKLERLVEEVKKADGPSAQAATPTPTVEALLDRAVAEATRATLLLSRGDGLPFMRGVAPRATTAREALCTRLSAALRAALDSGDVTSTRRWLAAYASARDADAAAGVLGELLVRPLVGRVLADDTSAAGAAATLQPCLEALRVALQPHSQVLFMDGATGGSSQQQHGAALDVVRGMALGGRAILKEVDAALADKRPDAFSPGRPDAFRALNAVSGLFQRCDYARKHAFAVISILKDEAGGNFPIKGFWMFRGQDIHWQMVEECPDLEVYSFVKADPNDPATRARVEAFLCEDEKIDGCTNMEAKVFK